MVLTRAGQASRLEAEAAACSIEGLPVEMQRHILSYVDRPEDYAALSRAGKSMLALASEPAAMGEWLWKHKDPQSCLTWAAYKRRGDVIIYLLKKGASATARVRKLPVGSAAYRQVCFYNKDACYPLLKVAVMYNLLQAVDYLWNVGPHCTEVRADVEGAIQSLYSAARRGHVECLQLLLAQPSPISAKHSMLPKWKAAEENTNTYPVQHAADDERPISALHEAVKEERVEAVQFLLSCGASCTFEGEDGRNALHVVCGPLFRPDDAARARIARAILDVPEGNNVIDRPDGLGLTSLHLASWCGLAGCCRVLLKAGSQAVNVRAVQYVDETPYSTAGNHFGRNRKEVQEVLLRFGANPRRRRRRS